ncbi:hypothetical protein OPV22_023760 [Ensete ventricosum]|uniref:BHLH domain-containing protein n=1 Tax=Ensete ventricosum TaxID=4639 RepID=A0AAV8QRD5_ENSVE|nr:hypothetical protein OPV22_023760 [Ensete ventricosum]
MEEFLEDSGFELTRKFPELQIPVMENSNLESMCYPQQNCLSHQPEFSMSSVDNLPPTGLATPASHAMVSAGQQSHGDKKMKSCGIRKRCRSLQRTSTPKEVVVHVRARRGEATDSHSLAERVRRETINKKMRFLRDLVPGCCCKAMGMAGTLDEIINYVRSLQNQVELLSMEIAAAATFSDNSWVGTPQAMELIRGFISLTDEVITFDEPTKTGFRATEEGKEAMVMKQIHSTMVLVIEQT